jgi:hypothetical protein
MFFNVAALAAFTLLPLALSAPVVTPRTDIIPANKYLVVLKPSRIPLLNIVTSLLTGLLSEIVQDHVYDLGDFKGFSALLTDAQVELMNAFDQVRIPKTSKSKSNASKGRLPGSRRYCNYTNFDNPG